MLLFVFSAPSTYEERSPTLLLPGSVSIIISKARFKYVSLRMIEISPKSINFLIASKFMYSGFSNSAK